MNKILFISYYFPPIKAIGSLRSYFIAKNLMKNNWDVNILTTSGYKILPKDLLLKRLKNCKYLYIPTLDLQVIFNLLKNKKNTSNDNPKKERNAFFKKLRNSLPLNLLYEGGLVYIVLGVITGIYQIKKNNIKYIYSTYSPYSNHLIAFFIKKIVKDIYWIADFRDLPFGENNETLYFNSLQKNLNKRICKNADQVFTVSEGVRKPLLKYNNNIEVFTNGIDKSIDELLDLKKSAKYNDDFNIVYTGSLYEGKRDAQLLFKVIKYLEQLNILPSSTKLIYAGTDGYLWSFWAKKFKLEKYAENKGRISLYESLVLQKSASINLMLTWSNKNEKGILTGKLFEYLSTLNPIICLINGDKDAEIEKLFTDLNCGVVIYNENEKLLFLKLKELIDNRNLQEYNYTELSKYTYPFLIQKFESLLLDNNA